MVALASERRKGRPGRKPREGPSKLKPMQFILPIWMADAVRDLAEARNVPNSGLVTGIVLEWLKKHHPDVIPTVERGDDL